MYGCISLGRDKCLFSATLRLASPSSHTWVQSHLSGVPGLSAWYYPLHHHHRISVIRQAPPITLSVALTFDLLIVARTLFSGYDSGEFLSVLPHHQMLIAGGLRCVDCVFLMPSIPKEIQAKLIWQPYYTPDLLMKTWGHKCVSTHLRREKVTPTSGKRTLADPLKDIKATTLVECRGRGSFWSLPLPLTHLSHGDRCLCWWPSCVCWLLWWASGIGGVSGWEREVSSGNPRGITRANLHSKT